MSKIESSNPLSRGMIHLCGATEFGQVCEKSNLAEQVWAVWRCHTMFNAASVTKVFGSFAVTIVIYHLLLFYDCNRQLMVELQ